MSTPKLQAEGISKTMSGMPIISDVSLRLTAGETVCLLGKSGTGKSTLLNVLSGILAPDTGRVLIDGEDRTARPGRTGYMQQKDLLLPHKTIAQNLALPLLIQGKDKKSALQKARCFLDEFGLAEHGEKFPAQLSGGQRQRAALLRTFLPGSDIVLLDEPFSALDAITRMEVRRWYHRAAQRLSLSTVLITHDVDEAVLLASRVYVLASTPGRIIAEIPIRRDSSTPEEFELCANFLLQKKQLLDIIHSGDEKAMEKQRNSS